MRLLIVLPTKGSDHYRRRFEACKETWLQGVLEHEVASDHQFTTRRDANLQMDSLHAFSQNGDGGCSVCHGEHRQRKSPLVFDGDNWMYRGVEVRYRGLSDAQLGLTERDQHQNDNDPIRTMRMIGMVRFAFEAGYDYMFRTDTDAYVWVNRLLRCGFEGQDYMGWCVDRPVALYAGGQDQWCLRGAHGGIGFFLSRKAMEVLLKSPIERFVDGKFWGDLWTGQQLWKNGFHCQRDTRFLDGSSGHVGHDGKKLHHGNIFAHELPASHPYVSIHPVPAENMMPIHERFKDLPAETTPPVRQIWSQ